MNGPTFSGLYGRSVTLADGSVLQANDDYLRLSITQPHSQLVRGYQPVMPSYSGVFNDDRQLSALIAFIRNVPAPSGVDAYPVELAMGDRFLCARKSDGTVLCEGRIGPYGADGSTAIVNLPVANAIQIVGRQSTLCVRTQDGNIACVGRLNGMDDSVDLTRMRPAGSIVPAATSPQQWVEGPIALDSTRRTITRLSTLDDQEPSPLHVFPSSVTDVARNFGTICANSGDISCSLNSQRMNFMPIQGTSGAVAMEVYSGLGLALFSGGTARSWEVCPSGESDYQPAQCRQYGGRRRSVSSRPVVLPAPAVELARGTVPCILLQSGYVSCVGGGSVFLGFGGSSSLVTREVFDGNTMQPEACVITLDRRVFCVNPSLGTSRWSGLGAAISPSPTS